MGCADRYGKCIHASLTNKTCGVSRLSEGRCGSRLTVLSDVSQLTLNRYSACMCQIHHATREGTVIIESQFRTVNHHGCITLVDAPRCQVVTTAMVQMQRYRFFELIRRSVSHRNNHS